MKLFDHRMKKYLRVNQDNQPHKLNRILESEGLKTHIFQVFRKE
ncbi:hypothetical protein LEP1GSC029_0663 [Leptospira interrogans str. 2002000626]|uniref:Uncharacterized protein n=1 Tax=Leptospira interrogans str. 2002000626 TaxID=996803 RepID=A0A829D7V3_LEPIR|nr:hypothetical protein LEP1GSC029_0663 [Leptospira interrogans str. 2002000626]